MTDLLEETVVSGSETEDSVASVTSGASSAVMGSGNLMSDSEEFKTLAKILFPDSEGPKLDAEQLTYLGRLGTQGLESLVGEVARVNEELAIIEHQTRDMASQNYQIFVQSAQTTNLIKKSLSQAKDFVDKLTSGTFPHCKSRTDSFFGDTGASNEFMRCQKGVKTMLEKKPDMEKVLDMPWTVRRCLASSDDKLLPEAIKILQVVMDYKKGLEANDSHIPTALVKTTESVLELQSQIQNALLLKLQSPNIGLSDCLQTVQLLRNFFPSDQSLRFRFLQSRMNRDVDFENSRSWIFDTLTQHRAAFGQDSNHYLSTFICLQLNRVLTDLQKHIEVQTLDSLYTNASYFGESLARVGADIRGLVTPMFSDFIVRKTNHDLMQAEITFTRNLHQFNFSTCIIPQESSNLDLPTDLTPPHQLIPFFPLAIYCNEVLSLLNYIGKCPLTQCAPVVCHRLNASIAKVGSEIESWGESEKLTWEMREQSTFNRMRRIFEHLLVPHIDKVFRILYPPTALSVITGISVVKCAEMLQVNYVKSE
ncbi:unnamed protein product [Orchesella dallaii]|uniref:Conserved oligomeric Golgi complex subunit 8 n=1 Tax=Orchesella dallaii TaxID=48710 RepID=A0ABP1QXH3_9HEXA